MATAMRLEKRIAKQRTRRGYRVGNAVRRSGRVRLSVYRSNRHIYAQVIDDTAGRTLAAASSMEPGVAGAGKNGGTKEIASQVGKLVAERAIAEGVTEVAFDRGSYRYHGRVAALSDAAREAGLKF